MGKVVYISKIKTLYITNLKKTGYEWGGFLRGVSLYNKQ